MKDYNTQLSGYTFQQVYAQFYTSANTLADTWFSLSMEEKEQFIQKHKFIKMDSTFEQIDQACLAARSLAKELDTLEEVSEELAVFFLRDAMLLMNYKDAHEIRLWDYMQYIEETFKLED